MKEEPAASVTNEGQQQTSDSFAASLNDPQFLRDVLRDLPGVDVDSDAVRAALEQVQQQQKKDTDDKSDVDKTKKDEK
jgi:26S proteasome regulatory subunit N10